MSTLTSARLATLSPQYSHGQTDKAGARGADSGAGLKLAELLGSKVCDGTFQLEATLLC